MVAIWRGGAWKVMDKDFGRAETMMRSSCLRAAGCWDGEENVDTKRRDLVQRRQALKYSQIRFKLLKIRCLEIKLIGIE